MASAHSSTQRVEEPVKLKFDGSVLPPDNEHGPSAAVGYVLTDASGSMLAQESYSLQCYVSNTHVEYQALIDALDHALDLGASSVYVYGDSSSVIGVVDPNRTPSANDRMTRKFAKKARQRVQQFDHCHLKTFHHTEHTRPRDNNKQADDLARQGHSDTPWN